MFKLTLSPQMVCNICSKYQDICYSRSSERVVGDFYLIFDCFEMKY